MDKNFHLWFLHCIYFQRKKILLLLVPQFCRLKGFSLFAIPGPLIGDAPLGVGVGAGWIATRQRTSVFGVESGTGHGHGTVRAWQGHVAVRLGSGVGVGVGVGVTGLDLGLSTSFHRLPSFSLTAQTALSVPTAIRPKTAFGFLRS